MRRTTLPIALGAEEQAAVTSAREQGVRDHDFTRRDSMATSLTFNCITQLTHETGECFLLHLPSNMGLYGDFLNDSRFRNIHGDTHYIDHYAVLSPSEAWELIELYYRKAVFIEHEGDYERIEATIKNAQIVVAHYYEWESGLD